MPRLLHRLVYQSFSRIGHDDKLGLDAIFRTSVRNNRRGGITGVLAHPDGTFIQVLEGSHRDLARLMQNIKADTRHRDIKILAEWTIGDRLFGGWAMAKPDMSPIDSQSLRDAAKGGSGAQVVGLLAALLTQPDRLFSI